MTSPEEAPLVPRPAATVMLVRDTGPGLGVFLMRRHAKMEFAAGTMVFPGGGVDDRDRNADIAWAGPPPEWWAQRFGIEPDLAEALVCAAARETFEESGVLFAGAGGPGPFGAGQYRWRRVGVRRRPPGAGRRDVVVRGFPAAGEPGAALGPVAAVGQLGHPEAERTRRYDTYFSWAPCRRGSAPTARTPNPTGRAGRRRRRRSRTSRPGAALLPPTWTQLDSLAGRTVAEVLAVERQIVPVQPHLEIQGDNWVFEFFDSDRYHQAREAGGLGWRH